MKVAISEVVGRAKTHGGEEVSVYRALRELMCASCGRDIACADLFTRRKLGGVSILPRCRKCAPFIWPDKKGSGSELINSLLVSTEEGESRTTRPEPAYSEKIARAVERRLGRALARTRRPQNK
jgi:hypothetical protein